MPKLDHRDVERNQERIEMAALRVFTRQGYYGTSVREIARAAGVSIGNIYNYYRTKEELYIRLVRRYEARIEALQRRTLGPLLGSFDPSVLMRLAKAIREVVYDNPDYWRLMYIDVTEFGNRHFAHTFRHLSRNLETRLGLRLGEAAERGGWTGVNPALAFTAIYLQFFTYFLVEKLFGGKQHLGMSDERAIAQLIQIFTEGVCRDGRRSQARPTRRIRS